MNMIDTKESWLVLPGGILALKVQECLQADVVQEFDFIYACSGGVDFVPGVMLW